MQDAGNVPEKLRGREVYAIIWTTTPWTIPHSMALAFHPEFEYAAVESRDGAIYLVAKDLALGVAGACGFEATGVLAEYKGKELESAKLMFQHPFLDRKEPAVLADYVTLDQGTGIVHTAPGHGVEDFQTGQRYGIETYAPLDAQGRYLEGLPAYKGKNVFEANPTIVSLLRESGALLGESKFVHSYPHCWRCHRPVIFRATEQWFIGMDAIPKGKPAASERLAHAAAAGAGRNSANYMDARVGPGTHALDDCRPPRLVRLATALLGRADSRFLLRCVRQTI